jgi:hypothetical protein
VLRCGFIIPIMDSESISRSPYTDSGDWYDPDYSNTKSYVLICVVIFLASDLKVVCNEKQGRVWKDGVCSL